MPTFKTSLQFGLLPFAVLACSENNYTPTPNPYVATNPAVSYQSTNPSAPNYRPFAQPNNINPYITGLPTLSPNGQSTGMINPLNPNVPLAPSSQLQLQMQANSMFSCEARTAPYFYYYKTQTNNCVMRRQVTYTPDSCACAQASACDCGRIVREIQVINRTRPVRSQTTVDSRIDSRSDELPAQTSAIANSDATPTPTPNSATTPSDAASPSVAVTADKNIAPETGSAVNGVAKELDPALANSSAPNLSEDAAPAMLPTILNEDAKALYDRLAVDREKKRLPGQKKTFVRTGMNYKCMTMKNPDAKDKGIKDLYSCDFDAVAGNGHMKFNNAVKPGKAEIKKFEAYTGPNVKIGGPDNGPNEGRVIFQGPGALAMYNRLNVAAKPGVVDQATGAQSTVKTGDHLKCIQTKENTECFAIIDPVTGEVKNAI